MRHGEGTRFARSPSSARTALPLDAHVSLTTHATLTSPLATTPAGRSVRAHHRPQPPALGLRVAAPAAAAVAARAPQPRALRRRADLLDDVGRRRGSTLSQPTRACASRRADAARRRCAATYDESIGDVRELRAPPARRDGALGGRFDAAHPVVLHADAGAGDDRRVRRARRRLRLHGRALASSASRRRELVDRERYLLAERRRRVHRRLPALRSPSRAITTTCTSSAAAWTSRTSRRRAPPTSSVPRDDRGARRSRSSATTA